MCKVLNCIYIDHKLTFKTHVDHINTKLARGNKLIAKLRHFVRHDSLISFYYAHIQSYINYGATAWTSTAASYIEKINKQQRKCISLISFSNWNDSKITDLYGKYNILPLDKFIFLNRCVFIWKVVHNQFEADFISKFSDITKRADFASTRKFVAPFRSTSAGLNFITCVGIKQWNRLSQDITANRSLHGFKSETKKFLFHK